MNWIEFCFAVLELIGTVSFSISGSMVAIKKGADLFGILFLGILTSVGGGVLRDLLLGLTPPTAFMNKKYVILAFAASMFLFLIVYHHQEQYMKNEKGVDTINNIFDAAGLGIFTVIGVQTTQVSGYGSDLFLCLFLGVTTGVGGGLLRDIIVAEIPFVLKKRVYALAALAGAFLYWQMNHMFPDMSVAASVLSILLVFVIRMLSTYFQWDLPKAITKDHD